MARPSFGHGASGHRFRLDAPPPNGRSCARRGDEPARPLRGGALRPAPRHSPGAGGQRAPEERAPSL
eukprot:2306625-Prymnesium_polylepis.1